MAELNKVNTCDTKCPRKALWAVELRETTGATNEDLKGIRSLLGGRSLKQLGVLIVKGVEGIRRVEDTMACPQRNLPAETWTARPECADHVGTVLATRTIDVDALSDYEREVLGPYIPQPPAEG